MKVERFVEILDSEFYAGVPDSQLKALCNYLMNRYGVDGTHHIIAANEGNAVGLAAGYHLATGKIPVVYMQNSGEGNVINPVASLLNEEVYAIPCIFVIGWRGEPGVHDEPQHIFQGKVTCKLLEDMDIAYTIIDKDIPEETMTKAMEEYEALLSRGKQVAFVIRKGALEYDGKVEYKNGYAMLREEIIRHITKFSEDDLIISTTGKASRELFEIREQNGQDHSRDFLTVGSMGHSSSIALELALQKPDKKIWIIDGDGAALMHLGAMAVIGANKPKNVVHIIINNGVHETVGGQPTAMKNVDVCKIAEGCGYRMVSSVGSFDELDRKLRQAKKINELSLIEVKCAIGARDNLGRPTITTIENKGSLMMKLQAVMNFTD